MSARKASSELIAKVQSLSDQELGRLLRRSREFAKKRRPKKRAVAGESLARWTPEETALLGTRPDAELARLMGRTVQAIALRRSRLKIPSPDLKRRRWSSEERALVGTLPDSEVAQRLGLPESRVRGYRESQGIPVFDRKLHRWTPSSDRLLGKVHDTVLAKKLGVSITAIKHRRTRLGIYLPKELKRRKGKGRPWTAKEIALLGRFSDREVAKKIGRWVHFVRWKRQELGISTPFRKRWKPEEDRWLGKLSDQEIARRTGRSLEAVALRRQKLRREPSVAIKHRWNAKEDQLLGKASDQTIARKLRIPASMVTSRRRFLAIAPWEPKKKR